VKKKIFFYIFTIMVLFTGAVSTTFAQTSHEVDSLIDLGIKYEHENKLDKAIETFKKALAKDPTNTLIKVRLAKILSWKNRYDEALTLLNEILTANLNHPEALFRKAQILSWQGKYKEAIATYQIYLLEEKNDVDALMGIARVCFWSGEYEKAITYFHRAITAGADAIDVWLNLGKVYLAMNETKEALTTFNKVLSLDPKNAEAKRFLKGIKTLKTFEITAANLRWDLYADGSMGVSILSGLTYHHKQELDFSLWCENSVINDIHDTIFTLDTTFREIPFLYLGTTVGFTIDPDFSPIISGKLSIHYTFKDFITPGIIFSVDKYTDDTLFLLQPEIQRDFSNISYIQLCFKQFFYRSGYCASQLGLRLNLEYSNNNPVFITVTYGGDAEIKDKIRRVFDFGFGISYAFTDNFESSVSYSWLETIYGKTHELQWQNTVKW